MSSGAQSSREAEAVPGGRGRAGGMGSSFKRIVAGEHLSALMDQAVVSGTSFLSTVAIARSTDATELGTYATGMVLVAVMVSIQDVLVIKPYAIQRFDPLETPARHAGDALLLSGLLSALGAAVALLTACAFDVLHQGIELIHIGLALSLAIPLVLLREFCRRFAFARLSVQQALILDGATAVIQIAGLLALAWFGLMSAPAAYVTLGAACGLASLGWLHINRRDFKLALRSLAATARRSWTLGKWLLAGQLTREVQQSTPYWLTMLLAGPAVTGVFAACMSIASFANPLIFGIGNILTPRSARAWKSAGGAGLRRQAVADAIFLGAVVSVFCIAVMVAGGPIMQLLFHGSEFAGHGATLDALALSMLAAAIGLPAMNALAGMERPRAIVSVGIAAVVLGIVLIIVLMAWWGIYGAAAGFLLGNVAAAAGRWIVFLRLLRSEGGADLQAENMVPGAHPCR